MDLAHQASTAERDTASGGQATAAPGRTTLVEASSGGEGAVAQDTGGAEAKAPAEPPNKSGITVAVHATAAGNPSNARTSVGVGEQVTFSGGGDGAWTAAGAPIGSGTEATWTAPDVAGKVEIAHGGKKLTMTVVAPTGVDFKSVGGFPVAPAGVGMTTAVTILPTAVSFGAAKWLEKPGPPEEVQGYFAEALTQDPSDKLDHKPTATPLGMGAANNAIEDHAWTSDKKKLRNPADGQTRYWAGHYAWDIPNHYQVGDGPSQEFTRVKQAFTMDDQGRITVTKGAATASSGADGKVEGATEKYATVGQAHAALNRQGSPQKMVAFLAQYNASPGKDADSMTNLVKAITEQNLELYLHVHCVKTFSWVTDDGFAIKASSGGKSQSGAHDLNNDKNWEFRFAANDTVDFASLSTASKIDLLATVDGKHEMPTALAFPFANLESQSLGEGKYTLTARLQLKSG